MTDNRQCGTQGQESWLRFAAELQVFPLACPLLGRCWMSQRLRRHNLQNGGRCALCSQSEESIEHLLVRLQPRDMVQATPGFRLAAANAGAGLLVP